MAQFMALVRRDLNRFSAADFTPELLEQEAQRARQLYADGVYRAMWGRQDHPGAVVLIEAGSAADVRAAFDSLPLAKLGMLALETVVPLTPYRGFGPRG